jgi:outer membrane protein OmpA-like peptidoglycan-associated protein
MSNNTFKILFKKITSYSSSPFGGGQGGGLLILVVFILTLNNSNLFSQNIDKNSSLENKTIKDTNDFLKLNLNLCSSLPDVYFKKGECNLDSNHQFFLDSLVLFLNENPGVTIDVIGFSDSKGDFQYNLDLSKHRAKNIFKYLNKKGIKKRRMKLFWYGESKLMNQCKDDIECSEEMHQLNRRVEFRIIFPKNSN